MREYIRQVESIKMKLGKGSQPFADWEFGSSTLEEFDEPFFFFMAEPLITGHISAVAFEMSDIRKIRGSLARLPYNNQFMAEAASSALELITHKDSGEPSSEVLHTCYITVLISFLHTETSNLALDRVKPLVHGGAIYYNNPINTARYTRPAVIIFESEILHIDMVRACLGKYIEKDRKSHPELFYGVNLDIILTKLQKDLAN